ncbi:uncharacterized protein LOC108208511 [Daucus carota subsp. sativus]|uniref:uncharacterized protein LOC108208511 n=1 Tax=Daucus carota subsp. sativus TaxID=79200 RepID=UPI0007EF017D|nr:PREDICTED: uncharacterized protein LOC108208511 isoform X2 [Daucus carota subsp. sativus]
MAASGTSMMASNSENFQNKGMLEMHKDEAIRFICPNFATDYIPGVLKLPREFCVENSSSIPERVLLNVPPRVLWKGLYRNDTFCIEGLEKMMSSYSIKAYHLVLFEYHGGHIFYIKIFNPYGVEISYHIENRTHSGVEIDKKLLTTSGVEEEKLCGTLSFNAYESCKGICDVVVQKKDLRKSAGYAVFEKQGWESLGLVESMDSVKLSYKSRSWVVKLHWQNGKLYMGRNWYSFASAGNLQAGDTIAFQKTEIPQKYAICVFEKDLLGKCNLAGVGQKNGIMDWFKIADLQFISTGEMEIPRVFTKLPGFRIPPIVNLVTCDGQTLIAKYSPERNLLFGMTEMIRKYSIRATDVMIFSLSNNCTFVVSLFKISGMESKYIVAERYGAETVVNSVSEQIRNNAQANLEGVELENATDAAVNAEVDNGGMPIHPISFKVTLKPSHVDKRQHGVYFPPSMYPTYQLWSASTMIRLICGAAISMVSVLRSGKVCRFGKGWSEFTVENKLLEGQVIQLTYVDNLTFLVTIVQ